ncbi:MAG: hypothetical protein ACYTEQ_15245 [Planctomycetota bacterium]|jgi:hypothetical protein
MAQFFIKRPHAIDQFRKRAGYGEEVDNIRLEASLRQALDKQASDGMNFLPSRKEGEFVLRIDIPEHAVVYAVLAPAPGKAYDYYVSTVITEGMFQSWTKSGRLGSLQEQLEASQQEVPVLKPSIWLRYTVGPNNASCFIEHLVEDLDDAVRKLIKKGVRVKDIEAFKRIPLDICVRLPGFTP